MCHKWPFSSFFMIGFTFLQCYWKCCKAIQPENNYVIQRLNSSLSKYATCGLFHIVRPGNPASKWKWFIFNSGSTWTETTGWRGQTLPEVFGTTTRGGVNFTNILFLAFLFGSNTFLLEVCFYTFLAQF
jgi:hypothetical protein